MPSSSWWRRDTAVAAVAAATVLTGAPAALAGFSLTTTAAPTLAVTLDGSDQTASYSMDLTVDNSGVGSTPAGWNLTVTSTQFSTGGGSPATLSTGASSITALATVCAVAPCADPANTIAYPLGVPAGSPQPIAVKFFSTPAITGIGTFTVTPTVQVSVPANAYAANYTSTLELTLISGP